MFNLLKKFFDNVFSNMGDPDLYAEALSAPAKMEYLLNDPTTPNLKSNVVISSPPKHMNFSVKGYAGGAVKNGTPKHQAASSMQTLCRTIEMTQKHVAQFRGPLKKWAVTNNLIIVPRAGKDFNAYYNRKKLVFFFSPDPKTKKMVYAVDSADVIAHEAGHAILDAMRPDFWSVAALEIWSFHEAFADITAMLTLMESKEVMQHALDETNGDMMKSNVINRLAEEMGNAVYHLTAGKSGYTYGALREANNNFKYINPKNLPKEAPANELAAECHSFGRIFLGAWYEIMVDIYNQMVKQGDCKLDALTKAKNIAGFYLIRAIPQTPRTPRYFEAAAKSMMAVDKSKGSPYGRILRRVFTDRNIIKREIMMLSSTSWNDIRMQLQIDDEVVRHQSGFVVKKSVSKKIKLSEHLTSGLSEQANPLFNVEMEVPADNYYEFNESGILIEEVISNEEEALDDAIICANLIHENNAVSNSPNTMWEIIDGKLKRTFIQ
jgi:hypothetical protein